MGLLTVLLAQWPLAAPLLYPLKLFTTFLHEASHGLAAILTGGRLIQFTLAPDTSGLALTAGGFRPLVLVAGYVGSCVWGGLLLLASRRVGWEKGVLFALAAFIAVFTLLFVRNGFGFLVGSGLALSFGALAWRGPGPLLRGALAFLAVQNSFYALGDLVDLLTLSGRTQVVTDAMLMSREMSFGLIPPLVFALGIAGLAVVIFLGFLRLALKPSA